MCKISYLELMQKLFLGFIGVLVKATLGGDLPRLLELEFELSLDLLELALGICIVSSVTNQHINLLLIQKHRKKHLTPKNISN